MSTIYCADQIVKIYCTGAVSNLPQRLQRHPPSVYNLMKEEEKIPLALDFLQTEGSCKIFNERSSYCS